MLLGHFYPETGAAMKPLGDGFIKLIKMIIAPIIFCTVVVGIAGMEDMKSVGKTGGYALLYFEIVSTIALIVGPGDRQPGAARRRHERRRGDAGHQGIAAYTAPGKMQGTVDFLLAIIPNTVVDAFAKGEMLQVLLFAVMFGFALHTLRRPRHAGVRLHREDLARAVRDRRLHHEGGADRRIRRDGVHDRQVRRRLAGVAGQADGHLLRHLPRLRLRRARRLIARFHGFSIWKFIKYIKEELLIVLGTSSSESVLPRMMAKLENLGVRKSAVGLVVPTGYSFNLDGTSIYLTMAAVFIAQATNTPMTLTQQLTLLLACCC